MSVLSFAKAGYQEIRRRVRLEDPDLDDETLADTVEGLTELNEILSAIVRGALTDESLAWGLKQRIQDMQERRSRLEERAGIRRRIVRDVMLECDLKKLTDAEFTISIRAGSAALVVIDPAAIPTQYWQPQDPRLDKAALLAELRGGCVVAGVELSNPEPVLSVRSK